MMYGMNDLPSANLLIQRLIEMLATDRLIAEFKSEERGTKYSNALREEIARRTGTL